MERSSKINRVTNETNIKLKLELDGNGESKIETGIGFFNHMLEGFARHGFFNLEISAQGDIHVDGHHTVEDIGIVLGDAINKALSNKTGIRRFGNFILPMDDALVLCAVDLSGRPYLNFECEFSSDKVGNFETQLVKEFFYALSYRAGINLHIKLLAGQNDHHKIEAIFKAFAKALDEALSYDSRITDVLSTKGVL